MIFYYLQTILNLLLLFLYFSILKLFFLHCKIIKKIIF